MNETMGGQASLQKLLRPFVANAKVGAVAKMIPPYLDRYLIAFALSLAIDMPALAQTSGSTGLGGPSSVQGELQPGDGLTDLQFRSTIVQDALPTWFAWKEMLAEEYGLSFKVDYLSLGQWSDADIGEGQAGSGIARLYGSWAPFETGSLTFKVENRHASVVPLKTDSMRSILKCLRCAQQETLDRYCGTDIKHIPLKNAKIAMSNVFVIGAKKCRKPPLKLLAPTHRRSRVAIIKILLPPRPKFPKSSL